MRVFGVVIVLCLLVAVVGAQAPTAYPVANLAQVMRAIYCPNANIIFDVQMRDPDAPRETTAADGTVSSTFASIYLYRLAARGECRTDARGRCHVDHDAGAAPSERPAGASGL